MDILFLLIPVSVVLVFAIGAVFWWAVDNGQFDDMEGPAYRVVADDDMAVSHGGSDAHGAVKASTANQK
jgi:cbb3-type cytochrome oxidase maturation protein